NATAARCRCVPIIGKRRIGPGNSIATGTSFTTPVITAATTYYVEAKSSTGCVSAGRTAVNVYVTTEPICSYATQQQSP
ncbi:hypothetical protein ACCS91_39895, partial [Rhizobium ruizarguesonis]